MKKFIITAVLVLCGTIAQAASINWSANVIQSSPSASVGAGWVVQVYSSDVVFSYDAAKAGDISAWQSGATVAAGTTFRASGSGTQDNGTTAYYYAVVYDSSSVADAKNYIISDVVKITTSEGGASVNLSFGAMNGTTVANTFLNSSWTSVGGGSGGDSGAPEPTSGLLLVVGGALLALRRKQK